MKSGILNIYKEAGYTSFDVVAKLRTILGIRKIGHTGTLDPDATGVLPVCIGKATKVCDLLTDKDKTYEAIMQLGITTDTQDLSGKVLSSSEVSTSEDMVREVISHYVGKQWQTPPMYSAKKVNGKKLYEYARAGEIIERKPVEIYVYEIEILSMNLPEVSLKIHCSKGTYIRTLIHDIGQELGCGAAMKSLKRTQVSQFLLSESLTLSQIEVFVNKGVIESYILPIDEVFSNLPQIIATDVATNKLRNGNKISLNEVEGSVCEGNRVRLYLSDNRFVGIFVCVSGMLKPEKMFLEE